MSTKEPQLFQTLRAEVALAYIAALVLLAVLYSHPFFLLGLFVALNAVIYSAGIVQHWIVYLKFSLVLIFLIMLINTLFVRAGTTILWQGPCLPVLGKLHLSLEALSFGAGMGLRLLVMLGAFCLLTYALHPDSLLKTLGAGRSKMLLTLSMALRLFPLVAQDFVRITEAQHCRGVSFLAGNRWQRVRQYVPVLNTVLLSSLERSFQLAEALQARGYGANQRTAYREDLWRPRDIWVLLTALSGLLLGVVLALSGWAQYSYYPRLQAIDSSEVWLAGVLSLCFSFPALLHRGWKTWPLLKSRS